MLVTSNINTFLGYVGLLGLRLRTGVQVFIEDTVYGNSSFQKLLTSGKVTIDSFDASPESAIVTPEVQQMIDDSSIGGAEELLTKNFNFASTSPLFLKQYEIDSNISSVIVNVTEAFTAGATMSLGFPANNSEVVAQDEIDLTKVQSYEFQPLKVFESITPFNLYKYGVATSGSGVVFFI